MSTYAIGDVQGCYDELQALLETIAFDPAKDQLWFAGDLVNRGPQSLAVLRFIHSLKDAKIVLGNHDIHLISLANGSPYKDHHTLHDVLAAPDCHELIDWLREQPLFYYDPILGYAMVHAGLLPQWDIPQAQHHAAELEAVLRSRNYRSCLPHLQGNQPKLWDDTLSGWNRLRFILNAFTRLRFCTREGQLDFTCTGKIGSQPEGYMAWFQIPNRASRSIPIIHGHWAALEGKVDTPNIFALDTGCAWGGSLTAMRLEDRQCFSVPSKMEKFIN